MALDKKLLKSIEDPELEEQAVIFFDALQQAIKNVAWFPHGCCINA